MGWPFAENLSDEQFVTRTFIREPIYQFDMVHPPGHDALVRGGV
jgi:hypothetical protein